MTLVGKARTKDGTTKTFRGRNGESSVALMGRMMREVGKENIEKLYVFEEKITYRDVTPLNFSKNSDTAQTRLNFGGIR